MKNFLLSLENLTDQRDIPALQREFLNLLNGHFAVEEVRLYQLCNINGDQEVLPSADLAEIYFRECLSGGKLSPVLQDADLTELIRRSNRKEHIYSTRISNRYYFLIRGYRRLTQILVLNGRDRPVEKTEDLMTLLRIYRNLFLSLKMMDTDGLTRLLNHQAFEDIMRKFSQPRGQNRMTDGEKRSYLALIDPDRFKRINDTQGHVIGDEVLIHFSNLLRNSFRFSDFVFRFGGEEFAVIVNEMNEKGALKLFEKLLATIREYRFPAIRRLTATIGLTEIIPVEPHMVNVEKANRALQYGKTNGRDRLCCYEHLIRTGEITEESTSPGEVQMFRV